MKTSLTFVKADGRWFLYLPTYGGKAIDLEVTNHANKVLDFVQGDNQQFIYMTVDVYSNAHMSDFESAEQSGLLKLQRFWQSPRVVAATREDETPIKGKKKATPLQGARYHLAGQGLTDARGNVIHDIMLKPIAKRVFRDYPRSIAIDLRSVKCSNFPPYSLAKEKAKEAAERKAKEEAKAENKKEGAKEKSKKHEPSFRMVTMQNSWL